LAGRYAEPGPKRLLALDGGGIRGVMTLEILHRMESLLRDRYGGSPDFRLAHYFDYIGGTSTGAIIAAALARGMSVHDVRAFYSDFGREVFRKRPLLERLQSLYQHGALENKLKDVYDEKATLEPEHLKTLLLIVTRNATTDSAWPVSSNPSAKYNALERRDSNIRIPLWKLVRASTAAPVFFNPEVIQWDPADPTKGFVFVDGGTTAYNSPAFLMARMATEPAYALGWDRGERSMLIVSVGTGFAPVMGKDAESPNSLLPGNVAQTLKALMTQAQFDQDLSCRTIGRCTYGHKLDGEVDTLIPDAPLSQDLGRAFLYARYDALLTNEGLNKLGLGDINPVLVNRLDAVDAMADLACIGRKVGESVSLDHFGAFADPKFARLWAC
jgi:predicted acylesterase/phospholipase RssA